MPWHVEQQGEEYCVIKDDDGAVEGCHATEEEADAQVAALYAAEEKADEPMPEEGTPDAPAEPAEPMTEATLDVPSTIRKLVLNIQAVGEVAAKALGRKDDDTATGFKVQGNHWLAIWSNNFKDRDGEVFPQAAQDAYVGRVDKGITPLPELWVWHSGKESAIGAADWVARHGHFLMAAGQFYGSAHAQEAKAYYAKHAKNTGISHGFTFPESKFDGKAYHEFNTFEISLLPRGTEANWYTSLEGVKAMTLKAEQLDYLKTVFDEEHATRILADWDKRGKALEALNVEFKDFVQPDAQVSSNAQAVKNADLTFKQLVPDLMEGSAEAVTAALEAVKAVTAQRLEIAALKQEVAEMKAIVEQRPRASASPQTVVQTSHLSPELQKNLNEQNSVKDAFWGTTVVKTP